MKYPLGISPTGMNGIAWHKADELLMMAAENKGFAITVSTGSFTPLEKGKRLAPSIPKIFQFYFTKHTEVNKMVIRKLEESGYDALAVTVDAPIYGK